MRSRPLLLAGALEAVLTASLFIRIQSFHITSPSSGNSWPQVTHKQRKTGVHRHFASPGSIDCLEASIDQQDLTQNEVYASTKTALEGNHLDRCRALEEIGNLCAQRLSFSFDQQEETHQSQSSATTKIQKIPMRLPPEQLNTMSGLARDILDNGWMSTNADSVDGLPSFHVNLVSAGRPLFDSNLENSPFQHSIRSMYDTIQPFLDDVLLPYVQKTLDKPDLCIADVFLRHYGAGERTTLSAHYDVTSYATVVLALDDSASNKQVPNGLYTTASKDSNHAALRRFFPLQQGEGVLHTWNVLHGVDLDPSSSPKRTSLIVWFSTTEHTAAIAKHEAVVAPWLLETSDDDSNEDDGIPPFVLASAMESVVSEGGNKANISSIIDLYLKSAAAGNSFAFMRLGTLCDERSLTDTQLDVAQNILLHNDAVVPRTLLMEDPDACNSVILAKQFWYLSSLRGNSMAQAALADQLMFEATSASDEPIGSSKRTLAVTLFVLAAQQGYENAADSLVRCIGWEADHSATKDTFLQSPVLAIAATYLSSTSSKTPDARVVPSSNA